MGAFHAYDIRGKFGTDITPELAYKVGYFIPKLLCCNKVAVGRDMRLSSPVLHENLIKGITDAGADVHDLGLATTPYVYYATAAKGFKASVQITASHNPKSDNGLKVSGENARPIGYDNGLGTIEKWIKEGEKCPIAPKRGKVLPLDIREEYIAFQKRFLGDLSGLKIAMDLSNGAAALFVKDIFGESVEYLCDTMDGNFPSHEPNPLVAENREVLKKYVIENKSDIGVIYDGDADRVMFMDENGRFISPDLMIALMGHFFMEGMGTSPAAKKYGSQAEVLQDIRSSKAVSEYLAPMGAHVNTWRVGRAYAAPRLRELDGLFGGELAGHYYLKDFFYSDSGIMASLIILDVVARMKRDGKRLSDVIKGIEKYHNSGEINFKIEKKQEAMEKVRDYFTAEESPSAYYDFDGYRVEFPEWWFNIRPSNTEPYLRFICEATSESLLRKKVEKTKEIISALR